MHPALRKRLHRNCKYHYRPKRSFGQGNIFTSVCHSVHRGGGVPAPNFWGGAWSGTPPGRHPPPQAPPLAGTPPAGTPQQAPPRQAAPPGRHPPWQAPPPGRHPPPGIRSKLGRYASYWNAFLLKNKMKMFFYIMLFECFLFKGGLGWTKVTA